MSDRLTELLARVTGVFHVSTVEEMALRLVGAVLTLSAALWVIRAARRYLARRLHGAGVEDEPTIRSYQWFVQAAVWIIAGGVALHTLGIDLSHLFTTGGLVAVAFAFAMKNLAENLVAGLILRVERDIENGDVLCTESGEIMQVKKIGARTTIVRTKDDADRIIPNADLVQNPISNYTYRDTLHRLETTVGVSYESDLTQVRATLEAVCERLDWKSAEKPPLVLLSDFGDSSVVYRVLIWIEDPWVPGRLRSELNEAIWRALKDAGIVIAFTQLDVHIARDASPGVSP